MERARAAAEEECVNAFVPERCETHSFTQETRWNIDDCAVDETGRCELGIGGWGLKNRFPVAIPSTQIRNSTFVAHSQRRYR